MPQIEIDGCKATLACGGYPKGYEGIKYASIFSLITKKECRNKGAAKRVMRCIRKWSDKTGTPVTLNVGPFDDQPMCREQLRAFYISMGWKILSKESGYIMIYTPRRL